MKQLVALLLLNFLFIQVQGQAFLSNPLEGKQGEDFIIVNYVDWSFDSIIDHHCGTKTYDGHQGTDFVLRSFKQMDSGVYVLATANGRVTFAIDTFFDRETESVISKELGNYVCIKHPNKYYTYYAHLKKSSLLVQEGDSVISGQRIAQVASSGNSSDPHLHLEIWYDSSFVADPFAGNCGNAFGLWKDPYKYDTTFKVWDYGMHNKTININTLREREISIAAPYDFDLDQDTTLVLWSHLYGLRKGDSLVIDWINPLKKMHFTYTFPILKDWWYYYFWSNIDSTNLSPGEWNVKLKLNEKVVINQAFTVTDKNISIQKITSKKECSFKENIYEIAEIYPNKEITIYDQKGSILPSIDLNSTNFSKLPSGIYYLEIKDKESKCFLKISI